MHLLRSANGGWTTGVLPPLPRPQRASVNAAALAIGLTFFTSLLVVAGGPGIRLSAAIAVGLLLVTLARARPALGIIAAFVYLVFMAFLRRVLLGASDWASGDPMLLVPTAVALIIIARALALDRRPIAPDLISRLVLVLLVITFAQVFNPLGGGIAAGIAGLVFMAFPLFWFFAGREYLRDDDVERLMAILVGLGVVVACYGLWQLWIGHPPWDTAWLELPGVTAFTSLNVGGETRAFGTFSGFLEYGLFLGTALAISVWFVLRGRLVALLPIPLLAVGLVMSAGRQPLLFCFLAIAAMLGLRTGRPRTALLVLVVAGAIGAGGVVAASAVLGDSGGGAFVGRQVSGLANPLDPNSSTLLIHVDLAWAGIKSGFTHPVGLGTAATNSAAGVGDSDADQRLDTENTLGEGSGSTDLDVSNAFVAYGAGGGLLYLALVVTILVVATRLYFGGVTIMMPIIAVLLANIFQWGNGGNYALAALIWMLIGVVAARWMMVRRDEAPG